MSKEGRKLRLEMSSSACMRARLYGVGPACVTQYRRLSSEHLVYGRVRVSQAARPDFVRPFFRPTDLSVVM